MISLDVNPKEEQEETPEVYVKKWADFSSKYGLGYYLSNGAYGVLFNDSSKLILDAFGINIILIDTQDVSTQYNIY